MALEHSGDERGDSQVAQRLHAHLEERAQTFKKERSAFPGIGGNALESAKEKLRDTMQKHGNKPEYERLQALFLANYSQAEVSALSELLNSSMPGKGFRTRIQNAPNALLEAVEKKPASFPKVDRVTLESLRNRLMDAFAE